MPTLAIRAAGMVTAVGFNAAASCAAMRAGIRNVNKTNLWDMYSGKYLAAGKVPLPQWWVGVGKLAELAAPAIFECLSAAEPIPAESIPVLLGVASPDRPFRFPNLDADILPEIQHRLGFRLHPASKVVPRDHVSVVVALREAAELISDKQAPCVVVAAVDSLLQHELKDYYLSKHRLLTPKNSNGFSLGEAGSALLVGHPEPDAQRELRIRGMGLAYEKATIESDEPLRAEGMVQAIRDALREGGAVFQDLQYRITDLNGEHYKFKEMVLTRMRFRKEPNPKLFDLWHPIEHIGDVGAAIGPVILGVALDASQKGYGIGPTVLCTFGNDNGERAASVLTYHCDETRKAPTETSIARARR
jgi:3-oxoacyl-[acyl-carrier-protein] synthase-1